ncbi:oligosaccharide flippase family protein [Alicyclobacillus sp. SO9]|uniref:oligosaccharide flippase family protein n=1 Tax=Alicyclobacillus sp. SO9 TaxID=2665646 RepID=UPI0018E7BA18|nr:oligosaccharide flippase family protein [Alicyclobacillus sp. SO9]QQE79210.1 oligosaccharide flippase family protein [Alicyclobacillus sp. SO9]
MSLFRRAGLAFLLMSSGKLISYALQIVLTRLNTPEDYGLYSYAISVTTTLAVFASLGFNNSVIRFVPEYLRLKKYAELRGFLKTAFITTLVGGSILGTGAFVFFRSISHGLSLEAAVLFGLVIPLTSLTQYYSQLARGLGSVSGSVFPNNVLQPALLLSIVGLIFWLEGNSNVTLVALSVCVSYGLALLCYPFLLKAGGREWMSATHTYLVKKWTTVSASMILMVGFQTILAQADVIVIGSVLEPSATGFYNIGTKIAALASFVLQAVNQVFAPNIASLHASRDRMQLQRELTKAALLTFFPTLLIATTIYVLTGPVLRIFGPAYSNAEVVLHILLIGQIVNAAAGPVAYVLNLTGQHRVSTRIFGVAALVNVLGCYITAKTVGSVNAVAVASTLSMVLWNVWMHVSVVRRLRVWPSIFGVLYGTLRSGKNL